MGGRDKRISEFKANLIYRAVRATQKRGGAQRVVVVVGGRLWKTGLALKLGGECPTWYAPQDPPGALTSRVIRSVLPR